MDQERIGPAVNGAQNGDTTNNTPAPAAPQPDLTEARRLLDAGMNLVKLHPFSKRPIGDDWNKCPVVSIDDDATGYGLPLASNGLCSVDPDHEDMARAGLAAWGLDLDDILAAGVRTVSTRPNSGGRAAFLADEEDIARWLSFRVFDDDGNGVTVLELRARSENLQDVVPGIVYADGAGELQRQDYGNDHRFDDPPPIPDALARIWRIMSLDDDSLRQYERQFVEAIVEAGLTVHGKRPQHRPAMGSGEALAFPAPGVRGQFNRDNCVEDIIERHGYRYHQRDQRWSHPGATGAPGIRPIPGKNDLWQSDHAGDPLFGTFDAWAAHVQLDHDGDVEAAIEAQRPDPDPPAEEGPSTLPILALTGLNNRPLDPIPQIVEKIVPAGVATVLAAHGGVGKSQAALQLSIRVAAGRPFMGLDVEQCPVTYYSAEDDARILEHRLQRILRADDIDADSLAGHLHVIDATQIDPALFRESNIKDDIGVSKRGYTTAAYEALIEHCREAGSRLLVIDNASDVFEANENERMRVRQFMRAIADIARAIDGGVVLLSHVDKTTAKNGGSQSEGYSGSTAWHNSARSRLFLHGEDGFLTLEHQKSNHGPRAEDIAMTWHDGLLVEGHTRSRSDEMARVAEEAAHTRDILRLIRDCAERGQFISTSATAGNAWTVLRPMDGFPRVDRQTFWRLLNRAEQDGRIIREEYQDGNRKVKARFTVTEAGGEFIDMDDAA